MRDEHDRAFMGVDRLDQRGAAVDVEMVRRLVENEQMRSGEGGDAEQQPRLLAAGETLDLRVGARAGKAGLRGARANARLGRVGHQRREDGVGRVVLVQIVDLMLGEEADLELRRAHHIAALGLEPPDSSLAKVDLPLPLEPSRPMRSSFERLSDRRDSTVRSP